MLVVKVDDLNNIKVEPEEVHPMYSPVSYNAGYNQALKDIKEAYNGLTVYDTDTDYTLDDMCEATCDGFDVGTKYEAQKHSWIPIKLRPGTDEEYEEFSQYGDCPREDFRVFDSPMPDDEKEVLVTTRLGDVCVDTWHRDVDCCYFEDNCDDDDVIAWMPLPEGYKKEVPHEDS